LSFLEQSCKQIKPFLTGWNLNETSLAEILTRFCENSSTDMYANRHCHHLPNFQETLCWKLIHMCAKLAFLQLTELLTNFVRQTGNFFKLKLKKS
jgi:hypothetical protein